MTDIDGLSKEFGAAHTRIEAIESLVVVSSAADRIEREWAEPYRSELMHHLERKRVQLLRQSGALHG